MAGANVPLHACEHFYIVTEAIPGLTQLPVLRVPDECAYYKEDAGKILLGAFEPNAKPWAMKGIPSGFRVRPAARGFRPFRADPRGGGQRGCRCWRRRVSTPSSTGPKASRRTTPTTSASRPRWTISGSRPGSTPSASSRRAGPAWRWRSGWRTGEKPFDLGDVDISRMQPFQGNKTYLFERSKETLGLLYADHFPYRQKATARGVRRTPFHQHLLAAGRGDGRAGGLGARQLVCRAGADAGIRLQLEAAELLRQRRPKNMRGPRQMSGMYDMSSFGKIRVEGPRCRGLPQPCRRRAI